jgi:hypothetical protein
VIPALLGLSGGSMMIAYAAIGGVAVFIGGFLAGHAYVSNRKESKDLEVIEELEGAEGFQMTSHHGSSSGLLGAALRERKKRKALGRGVVRWHVIGSAFEKPRYIKPERKEGGNVPEVELDGETYIFPEEATVPSEEEGVPTIVHRKGEAEPLELRDPWDDSVDARTLAEYLTLRVTSRKPSSGLLDGLGLGDMDSMDMFRYGILGIVGLAILWEFLG